MMKEKEKARLASMIEERIAQIDAHSANSRDARSAVTLDQQSVGRLSRMDAMQQQAMAKATETRRRTERAGLVAALERLAEPAFGECEDCGDPIPLRRIEINPNVRLCVSCQSLA